MISDPTLRELFRNESAEHLQRLDEVLLRLEAAPGEPGMLEEAFREAHSMKGAARMLGLGGIQVLAHALEDSLNAARQGTLVLDSPTISRMLAEVDQIRTRVAAEVGELGDVSLVAEAPPVVPVVAFAPPSPVAMADDASAAASGSAFRIDSVRVDTRRLDELMTHAGELTVARTRLNRRLTDVDALLEHLAERGRGRSAMHDPVAMEDGLAALRTALAEDCGRLDALSLVLQDAVRQIRLVPVGKLLMMFPRMVRELAEEQGKDIELRIEGEEVLADKRILEDMKDPLTHLLRNAVDHGIELPTERLSAGKPRRGVIVLSVSTGAESVGIEVRDDGRGLDSAKIRDTALRKGIAKADELAAMSEPELLELILAPGFSTREYITETSGRGVGLDVVRTQVGRLKGTLEITSPPGLGTRFFMRLPTTLSTIRVFIVDVGGYCYGIPTEAVVLGRNVVPDDLIALEGRPHVLVDGVPHPVSSLAEAIALGEQAPEMFAASRPAVFLRVGGQGGGFFVDAVRDEVEVVLKPQCELLQGLSMMVGAAILDSGEICTVLNPGELLAAQARALPNREPAVTAVAPPRRKLILLAEDSITTRTQETRILEGAGYEVVAAVDGLDAFARLATRRFDALVTDVNMPRLDGLRLAERVRALPQYVELPIILVTSLSTDDDKRRGLEVGANAYITKPEFDQSILLDCLERLVG